MTTEDREDPGMLDVLDTALIGAIKGAVYFPLVVLPRLLQRTLPSLVKLLRVLFLAAVWCLLVFGPLAILDDVREPFFALLIVSWTVLASLGSAVGVIRLRRVSARRRAAKPADLREAFA